MEVGKRLKERRNELHLTQDYVAEKLGITRQTMSNWENGRSYPDIERIIRLSDIYDLSLDELLKGDKEMVHHLQENTKINRFLKTFALLLLINIILMLVVLFINNLSDIVFILIFTLIAVNTLSIFYLIIKKI